MTDNARIVRDFIEGQGMHPNHEARILAALTALETELATAQADLARAREAGELVLKRFEPVIDTFIFSKRMALTKLRAALAPEQKEHPETPQL